MKRILPDPTQDYPTGLRPVNPGDAYQHSLPSLPLEILKEIFKYLSYKDTSSVLRSYQAIYPVRANNSFWEEFFGSHFSSPRIVPELSWEKECEMQDRLICNVIAGRCTLKGTVFDSYLSCFAKDENGCYIIGFQNGEIRSLNLKTCESKLLQRSSRPTDVFFRPVKIVCQDGLYATQWDQMVYVWELETGKDVFSFQCKQEIGYSKNITRIEFIDGRLLIEESALPHALDMFDKKPMYTLHIFDPKSKQDPIVLPLHFCPSAMTLQDKTLFCTSAESQTGPPDYITFTPLVKNKIHIFDLETKICQFSFDIKFPYSFHLEMCIFEKKTLFLFSERTSLILECDAVNPLMNRYFTLWDAPGIPNGFCWGEEHSLPCSIKKLSFLFDRCFAKQFAYWSCFADKGAAAENFQIDEVCQDSSWVFNRGKLSFFSTDRSRMFLLDFTASKRELLAQIVNLLERGDLDALEFLGRMPIPVQDAIWGIYDGNCADVVKKAPEPAKENSGSSAKLEELVGQLGSTEQGRAFLESLLKTVRGDTYTLPLQEEDEPVDLGRLQEAILHYIANIQSP